HTRFDCDWSSDVCSSDLHIWGYCSRLSSHGSWWKFPCFTANLGAYSTLGQSTFGGTRRSNLSDSVRYQASEHQTYSGNSEDVFRSEERRVGKECRDHMSM